MPLHRVFEPFTIKGVEIPNRIGRSAHGTSFTGVGPINDKFIAYHLARAKGGVGLSILEAATVHPTSLVSLNAIGDHLIEGYRRLMAAIRPHGMRVFQQIWHGGNIAPALDMFQPPWGASPLAHPISGLVPNPMGKTEIEEIVASFANAARNAREGGIDGVEVHAAHGYLLMQFLSPRTNHRTDEYGGSLENRSRLLREIMVAVRKAVGDDYPLGIRCSASAVANGVSEADLGAIAQSLKADGLLDFLDVSWTDYFRHEIAGSMDRPMGYQLPSSSQVTGGIEGIPRMVIGRIRTLEEAEQVLRDGVADLVHMTRAHIADPDVIRKTRAGKPEQVRPCIGCNQGCWHAVAKGLQLGCTVNPAVGFEGWLSEELIQSTRLPAKVLVVGGGPAGMEAARVAALLGHRVTLTEASARLGGQLTAARRAPSLHSIGDIATWLEAEIFRLGVEVRLGSYLDADDVLAEGADFAVIATGAIPRSDGIFAGEPLQAVPGFDHSHVTNALDMLTNPPANPGRNAVVFDDVGHYEAIAAAEFLLGRGAAVTFVTSLPSMTPLMDNVTRVVTAQRRFAEKGDFTLLTDSHISSIGASDCTIRTRYRREPAIIPCDTLVFITAKTPCNEVYNELRRRGLVKDKDMCVIGDALAPRDLQFAITDAHRAVRRWHEQEYTPVADQRIGKALPIN